MMSAKTCLFLVLVHVVALAQGQTVREIQIRIPDVVGAGMIDDGVVVASLTNSTGGICVTPRLNNGNPYTFFRGVTEVFGDAEQAGNDVEV